MFLGLGYNCAIASELKKRKILSQENVVDNMFSKNLAQFVELIKHNGKGWFNRNNLHIEQSDKHWWVKCLKYETFSVHDSDRSMEFEDAYQLICQKKRPLLDKFCEIIKNYPDNLILVRSNPPWTKFSETLYLYDTLVEIRKNKPFILCVLQDTYSSEASLLMKTGNFDYYKVALPEWDESNRRYVLTDDFNLAMNAIMSRLPKPRRLLY